jgi:hypothetical protein
MYHSFGIITLLPRRRLAEQIGSYSNPKYPPKDIAGKVADILSFTGDFLVNTVSLVRINAQLRAET